MLGILAPNKLFLNSISVFTVYTELETLPILLMLIKCFDFYTAPCAIMAFATFRKPAMFAPAR